MANRAKLTAKRRAIFLETLRRTGNVSRAAADVQIMRQSMYERREKDPAFAAEWDDAVETFLDACESECVRRAVVGYDEPVFYKGKQFATVRKYSDRLLQFYLAARRYPNRQELSGPKGEAIPLDNSTTWDLSGLQYDELVLLRDLHSKAAQRAAKS